MIIRMVVRGEEVVPGTGGLVILIVVHTDINTSSSACRKNDREERKEEKEERIPHPWELKWKRKNAYILDLL